MSNAAIRVNGVVKEYEVYTRPLDLAMEVLTRRVRHTKFRALDGVCFDVGHGEVLGIIGPNGAGKSTLLKIITGVLEPSAGSVEVSGKVTAILELGLGFNPEYSGRDNIYLSGLLYGMDRAEVDRKIDDIVAFSGLGEFINRPVKTYSSGMHSRLAFSIATAVDPEILIIDEALAAGDAGFVQKSLRRIRQMCSGGRTVLLVSHGTGLLAQLCNRVVWLDRGRVRMVGPSIQVVQAYDIAAHQSADADSWIETVDDALDSPAAQSTSADDGAGAEFGSPSADRAQGPEGSTPTGSPSITDLSQKRGAPLRAEPNTAVASGDFRNLFTSSQETGRQVFRRGPVLIESAEMLNSLGERTSQLKLCERACLRIAYRVDGPLPAVTLGVAIAINNRIDLAPVAQFFSQNIRPNETRETYDSSPDRRRPAHRGTLELHFKSVPFRKGDYLMSIGLLPNEPATWEFYEYRHFYYPLTIDDAGMDVGAPVFLDLKLVHKHECESSQETDHRPRDSQPAQIDPAASEPLKTLRGEIKDTCITNGGYPDRWPRHAACPACGAACLADAFSKYGFNHERCTVCGFVAVNPYPPDDIIARLYAGQYYSRVRELFERPLLITGGQGTPFSAPRPMLEAIVEHATQGRQGGHWLDVGGGIGAFANLVMEMRPDWTVELNELNPQSVEIARSLFRFQISTADFEALRRSEELFDVVSSIAVVEHVPDPLLFLQGYASLVKPGGMLVTVVPHFTKLNATVSRGSSANAVPPFHLSLFNEISLRRMLRRIEGLDVLLIEQFGPPAFRLVEHVATGDKWDITIPTPTSPTPLSVQIEPYSDIESSALNALGKAEEGAADYFAATDGRMYLVAYCRRAGGT